jgi:hypothetical protein
LNLLLHRPIEEAQVELISRQIEFIIAHIFITHVPDNPNANRIKSRQS